MAVHLTRASSPGAAVALLLLCIALAPAHALGPSAPFTPPLAASAAAHAASAAAQPDLAGLAGGRLGAAPQALIDGQWHCQGSVVRGARLTAVSRSGVTLQHADGRAERLPLLPTAPVPAAEPARP